MLELLAALMVQETAWPEGLQAEYVPSGEVRGRMVHTLQAICPAQPEYRQFRQPTTRSSAAVTWPCKGA